MGLFDKKYCDFCGSKIGLLGNKKLEDGNMCKDCASKLSPWFSDRRHTTKAEIAEQLDYREKNKAAVREFTATRKIGNYMKLILDEDHQKFMVTSASDLIKANPDVLDYSQASGCFLEVKESRTELKTKNSEGKSVSYNPPRYEYSYNFHVTIHVDHPYFDEISYSISNGYVKVGERIEKGDELGYFLFGGSDCVMLFSAKTGFELTAQPAPSDDTYANGYEKILCRAQYGRFTRKS